MTLQETKDGRLPEELGKLPFYLSVPGLIAIVLALTAVKIWAGANSHFVEDEAYYRLWGLHPALGYYDHPPMIAWWIWAGQQLFGDTVFAVRALVIVSSALGSIFLWRTADIFFGRRAAGWAVLFLNTSLLVGIGGILATPDAPSVFFWGLAFWALAELQASKNANWWLVIGLCAGLGLVSKYSVFFLGAGILLWLVWVPSARRWFASWQLWAGGALALLAFAPVLYWNDLHGWVSFYKQFGRAEAHGFTTKYIFEFIGALLGLANPLIAVLAICGAWGILKGTWRREEALSLIILLVLPFLAYLLYHSLHARVQANWPAPLFPAFALMAGAFVAGKSGKPGIWCCWAKGAVLLGAAIALVVQFHAVHPLTGSLARKDPTFQLRGWLEVGDRLEDIAAQEGADYVLTTSYGLNGQLDFLLRGVLPVEQMNERIRYVMKPEPDAELFSGTGLYVTTNRRDRSDRLENIFGTVERVAEFPRTVKGVPLEEMRIYRLENPTTSVLEPVKTDE